MKVHVRPLRRNGRFLNNEELRAIPPYAGMLKVAEGRDAALSRSVIRAKLLDISCGTDVDVLPALSDATLIWAEGRRMRILGTEEVLEANYAQTWAVELV